MLNNFKKQKKIYIVGIFSVLIFSYFGYFIFNAVKYQHHNSYSGYDRYLWILSDSIKKDVDSVFYVGLGRESDNFYEYIIQGSSGKQFVTICHLKGLEKIDFDSIVFEENVSLDDLKIFPAEKFNLKSDVRPEITIKSKLPFNTSFKVNLDLQSEIIRTFNSNNYRGFWGTVNKMSIKNDSGKDLILFDYGSRKQPTLFLFYKGNGGVFFILINSEGPIDDSIIKILSIHNQFVRNKV